MATTLFSPISPFLSEFSIYFNIHAQFFFHRAYRKSSTPDDSFTIFVSSSMATAGIAKKMQIYGRGIILMKKKQHQNLRQIIMNIYTHSEMWRNFSFSSLLQQRRWADFPLFGCIARFFSNVFPNVASAIMWVCLYVCVFVTLLYTRVHIHFWIETKKQRRKIFGTLVWCSLPRLYDACVYILHVFVSINAVDCLWMLNGSDFFSFGNFSRSLAVVFSRVCTSICARLLRFLLEHDSFFAVDIVVVARFFRRSFCFNFIIHCFICIIYFPFCRICNIFSCCCLIVCFVWVCFCCRCFGWWGFILAPIFLRKVPFPIAHSLSSLTVHIAFPFGVYFCVFFNGRSFVSLLLFSLFFSCAVAA